VSVIRNVHWLRGHRFTIPLLAALVMLAATTVRAQNATSGDPAPVRVVSDAAGTRLQVGGRDFMVYGMNWDYVPIGENYLYSLWQQPDDVIEAALAREMPLLKDMGVNAIRQYVGIPPRWVQYIFERYGIYTVINHPCARYGYTLNGAWIPNVDYADPRLRAALVAEVSALVEEFQGVPGVLMWLLGNENNYGLSWTSFEAEALPQGERDAARAHQLYSLFGEIIAAVKSRDTDRPVAIANGDVQYIDVIAQECRGLDVFGTNTYRGISARDLFQVVKDKLGIPVMFTEFGADAFNTKEMREDQQAQARYLLGQWEEIYEQSAGKGRVGNAIGGFVFQWSDGWWKFGQESRLDVHDTNASWPNGGYVEDYVPGDNNMNEEWWGICAKGPTDGGGLFDLYPRAAYYALRRAFALAPYAGGTDLETIRAHFAAIEPEATVVEARGDRAALISEDLRRARLTGLRLQLETYSTGGSHVSTPKSATSGGGYPAFRGFDRKESFYADFEAKPAETVTGTLSLNILGNVPTNPIDEIFYENRGRSRSVQTDDGSYELRGIERVKVYRAAVSWDDRWFRLDGFFRTGHTHWGYEGDFFGLYRDAFYGENLDIYNGEAPVGFEIAGKRALNGVKLAFGPQLWWGANPAAMLKVTRRIGPVYATGVYHEEFTAQSTVTSSFAVPQPPTRRATLSLKSGMGPFGLEVGGIWSGNTKIGDGFQIAEETADGYRLLQDYVRDSDTYGTKVKLTLERGRWHWYGQAAYMGIVADGGPTATLNYTGWILKDTGSGNQANLISGVAVSQGNFQIAPNFLWQKPLVGPIPSDVPSPGRPRNILEDPFAVRANRETIGAELVLTYDPTPATWMWAWDNDVREDAKLAASLGVARRDLRTTQDASIGILGDGRTTFAFPGAPPPRKLWEANLRLVSRLAADRRLLAHFFAGSNEPNGDDPRLIGSNSFRHLFRRWGGDARLSTGPLAFAAAAKFNDWGPYDYHRDFNLTYPVQLMGDVSHSLGMPRWFGFPQTRLGVRGTWRSLDRYSPRYCPAQLPDATGTLVCEPNAPGPNGREWEIRTYLNVAM
jgi:hypothetical protein